LKPELKDDEISYNYHSNNNHTFTSIQFEEKTTGDEKNLNKHNMLELKKKLSAPGD